jgi:BMFP domain-containing protein YqiC
MQTDNRLLDDLARMASSALGGLQGVRGEIDAKLREQIGRLLAGMDLVAREEFDAVKAMAAAARRENERLAERLAALEAKLATGGDEPPAPRPDPEPSPDPNHPPAPSTPPPVPTPSPNPEPPPSPAREPEPNPAPAVDEPPPNFTA